MKRLISCIVFAGVAEIWLYHHASAHCEFSPLLQTMLVVVWIIGSIWLAWTETPSRFVYYGSVALAAPLIAYSQVGYGLLEMAGWFHVLVFGTVGTIFYKIRHHPWYRYKKCTKYF